MAFFSVGFMSLCYSTDMSHIQGDQFESFSHFLQREYLGRLQKNKHYSVRSFARDLEMDDSTLAKIMKGSRKPGRKVIENLAQKLSVSGVDLKQFFGEGKLNFEHLNVDEELYHSDWHYHAILEMTHLEDIDFGPEFISRVLNISKSEASIKMDLLVRKGLLVKDEAGKWHDEEGNVTNNLHPNFEHVALKTYQRSLHENSMRSIQENSAFKKDHVSYISALDSDLIPEIKVLLKKCRRDIADLIEKKSVKRDRVYAVTTNLFSLDERDRNEDN